jgi:hypothetical protein
MEDETDFFEEGVARRDLHEEKGNGLGYKLLLLLIIPLCWILGPSKDKPEKKTK